VRKYDSHGTSMSASKMHTSSKAPAITSSHRQRFRARV
jgi:hypothetical protein